MNWEAATAIAEWVGVILIIVSLICLALQIRQNTATIMAAADTAISAWGQEQKSLAHSR